MTYASPLSPVALGIHVIDESLYYLATNVEEVLKEIQERRFQVLEAPTGFENRIDSDFYTVQPSYAAGPDELTVTVTHVNDFSIFVQGLEIIKTATDTVVISVPAEGVYWIYYDSAGTLTASTVVFDFEDTTKVPVVVLYWDDDNSQVIYLGDERHSTVMDSSTHDLMHTTIGTRYQTGLTISGYTLSTDSNAAVSVGVAAGMIHDEDIAISIVDDATPDTYWEQDLSDPAKIPIFYRDGAAGNWRKIAATDYPFHPTGTGRLAYDNVGVGLAEGTNNYYIAYWIFATNDINSPIISIMGQREDNKITDAKTNNNYESLAFGTLPFQEMKVLYRIILQTKDAYTNAIKSTIEDVADYRALSTVATGTYVASSHSLLSDLSNDDHTQYLLADGTRALTGDWAVGAHAISGITTLGMTGQLTNTLAIGTPPFVITSTTVIPNLNVDQVDGYDLDQALLQASSPTFVGLTLSGAIATPTTITTSGDITCGGDLLVSGGDATISSSTETASLTVYNPLNDGNPFFNIGKDANDRFYIQVNFNAGTQELDGVTFTSRSTGAGANDGRFVFSPDNVIVLALDPRAGSPEGMIYAYGPIQFYNVESTPVIDINPNGTGSSTIIDITPSAALVAGRTWKGLAINTGALDPATGAACFVYGVEVDYSGIDSVDDDAILVAFRAVGSATEGDYLFGAVMTEKTVANSTIMFYTDSSLALSATATYKGLYVGWTGITRDAGAPQLHGLDIRLPADYTGFGTSWAGYFAGDGRSVIICDTTYALDVSGAIRLDGTIIGINSITLDVGATIDEFSIDGTLAGNSDTALPTEQAVKTYVDAQIAAVNSLAEVLALGNEADGTNILLDQGADLIVYSDDKVTEVARIDGATGNITTLGTVDGVDVAALKTDVDGFNDELKDLTQVEIQQLENIDASTISVAQWGYLGALDQSLIQASSPTFVGLTLSGAITGLTDLTMTGAIATATNISMSGELDLTGVNACIDLNPAGTGSKHIIDITPSAALVAGSDWVGIYQLLHSLDPATGAACTITGNQVLAFGVTSVDYDSQISGYYFQGSPTETCKAFHAHLQELSQNNVQTVLYAYGAAVLSATATYRGVHIDWDDLTRDANAPVLEGLRIQLPADYTDFGTCFAGYFSGGGETVTFCQGNWSILTGPTNQQFGIAMYGELQIAGEYGFIDLNPAGTGSKTIIDLVPSAPLVAGSAWYGLGINVDSLDPATGAASTIVGVLVYAANLVSTDNNASLFGFQFNPSATENSFALVAHPREMTTNKQFMIMYSYSTSVLSATATYRGWHQDWHGMTADAGAPLVIGINVFMPDDYTGFGVSYAAQFTGDGRSVLICDTTYALDVSGAVRVVGDVTVDNLITAGNVDGVDVSAHAADGDIHIAHSGVTITAGVGLSGGGTIAASRTIDCDITQYTDGLARTACLEDDVYGAGWDADVTHAPTQNAVYDKINAMDTLIAANTTVAEVEGIITAELVNGQSIDLAIDALINTHNAADNHVAHSGVTITAGAGMTGGGTIAATRTLNVIGGVGITVNADDIDCDITQYVDADAQAACVSDVVYGAGWDAVVDVAPSKNAVYDQLVTHYANTDEHHAQAHTHDGDTLQLDGINSNGGAFSLLTTGPITFNNALDGITTISAGGTYFQVDASGNVWLSVINADAGNPFRDSPTIELKAKYWTGAATADVAMLIGTDATGGAPNYDFFIKREDLTKIFSVDESGNGMVLGDFTVANLITAGSVDGVDISSIVAFKTITGITNNVVADGLTDTLTLSSANALLTIVGTTATDTIQWTVVEANFVLDGNTLQIDGINSDGGAFAFTTSGVVQFNNALAGITDLSMSGQLDMTGAGAWIDLNPAATGTQDIIQITPSAALAAGVIWTGISQSLGALDPATGAVTIIRGFEIVANFLESVDGNLWFDAIVTNACPADDTNMFRANITELTADKIQIGFLCDGGSKNLSATGTYQGLHIDWDGITRDLGAPVLQGARVQLPADYSNFGVSYAGYFSGDGRSVTICDTTYALNVSGAMNLAGAITGVTSLGMSGAIATATNISMTGELDMTGALACIDLNPASTGTKTIISMVPTAALAQGSTWRGLDMELGSLDPATGTASSVHGIRISAASLVSVDHDLPFYGFLCYGTPADPSVGFYSSPGEMTQNVATTGFYSYLAGAKSATATYRGLYLNWGATTRDGGTPKLQGVIAVLPANYTNFGACYAGYFSGGGQNVTLCNGTYAIDATGDIRLSGNLTVGTYTDIRGQYWQLFEPVNDGNPYWQLGSSAANDFYINTVYNSGVQTLDRVVFQSRSSAIGDGKMLFYPDAVLALSLHPTGDVDVAGALAIGGALTGVTNLTMTGTIATPTTITSSGDVTVGGDLHILGGQLKSTGGSIIWDMSGVDVTHHGGIYCNVNKVLDMGYSGTAWDECYADNWNNVSSWKTFSNPLDALRGFKTKADDPYKIDHNGIDDWLRSRIKARIRTGEGLIEWEGGYVLKPEKAKTKARKVFVDRLGKKVPVGNYLDGYSDEDFEHEDAYSINKTQIVLIQAIKQLEQRVKDLEAGS